MTLLPLSALREGQGGRVVAINGGRGCTVRLMSMGIVPGKKVQIAGRRGGAVLVSLDGTKFVIGRGLAMKVIVDAGKEG
ncbi:MULTISPECIES: FeoA family protein [unclassified Archaeoglobus]|jgi:ferrous iron transport protein A|uniref:FeoA family protein n=1 Tax=unclassified Archaeoglobus TaxID=2643606 RepID=UPI0025C3B954|nr:MULTISPECIES: FeoA domain-containing protein [unclassified Archaeoglobus]